MRLFDFTMRLCLDWRTFSGEALIALDGDGQGRERQRDVASTASQGGKGAK